MKKLLTFIFALIAMASEAFAESDVEPNYLCFEVKAGTTVWFESSSFVNMQYSTDEKKTWNDFSGSTRRVMGVRNDCRIYFRGVNPNGISKNINSCYFIVSEDFQCSGNVMSLIDGKGITKTIPNEYCFNGLFSGCPMTTAPELPATELKSHCYYKMFKGTKLTTAPALPATTLAESCYEEMFSSCYSLTVAPELPATTLADRCYYAMFYACKSLTTAPKLPATTLAKSCYEGMFYSCFSLTTAPELPATTLAEDCYWSMFYDCTSLTTAPKLPATTLAKNCYRAMFRFCTSLTTAPKLPATTLYLCCYESMFFGCRSLTTAPELPATTLANFCYSHMFPGCTSLTTAPKLPATTLAFACYEFMFYGCTGLTTAPSLPVTTLEELCYESMFSGCTSLTTAPELPATTLEYECYESMFSGCTSLTTAPELPATILKRNCYRSMFSGCTSLTTAPELPAITLAEECYNKMFSGCSQLKNITVAFNSWSENGFKEWVKEVGDKGVFYCPSDLPQQFGINYIPEGWQLVPISTFNINSQSEFVTIDKTSAKYNDKVNFSVADRTSDGYKLDKVLVNNKDVAVSNYAGSFDMMDYLSDVTITAQYSKITYTLTTDEYSQVANTTANVDDIINVTFKQLDGYNLTSATYNGKALTVNNYKSSFTMPAANVEIKTQYTKIPYTITTDEYSQVANTTANMGDVVNVTFKQREGYTLTSATYNGAALTVNNYKSSFTMPAANVEIKTVYAPIAYAVSCADANITADKTTATIEDKVNITIKDRASEGYKLDKVLVNSTEIAVKDFKASFDIKDYLKDVTISAQYSKIPYTITTDDYSQVVNTTAAVDDAISVTFKQREGFDLVSATYNGNPLNINNYKASFTMPAQNVEIKTVYAEKEYEIAKPSEGVSVSQPSAKAGDEITISVNPKDGYTVHLYVNGVEVALSGNSAVYIMPSGKIEITVKYVVEEKTPVSEIYSDNCAVSVFPNPAKSGEEITLKVGGKFDMNNAKIYLFNASGSLVMQIDNVKEYNQLTLRSGVYVGVLVTKGGKKTFRVAVK